MQDKKGSGFKVDGLVKSPNRFWQTLHRVYLLLLLPQYVVVVIVDFDFLRGCQYSTFDVRCWMFDVQSVRCFGQSNHQETVPFWPYALNAMRFALSPAACALSLLFQTISLSPHNLVLFLPATSYQKPVTSTQLPVSRYQHPAPRGQHPATRDQQPATCQSAIRNPKSKIDVISSARSLSISPAVVFLKPARRF